MNYSNKRGQVNLLTISFSSITTRQQQPCLHNEWVDSTMLTITTWTSFDIGKSRQNKLLVHRQTYMLQDLQTVSTTKHHWTNQVFSLLSLPIAQPGDTTGWAHRAYWPLSLHILSLLTTQPAYTQPTDHSACIYSTYWPLALHVYSLLTAKPTCTQPTDH